MAKTYRVTGPHRYRGHEPGSTFDADLSEDQEARAVERGSIVVDKPAEFDEQKSREDLDEIARNLGVAEPEKLGNKAEVIKAIRSYDKE